MYVDFSHVALILQNYHLVLSFCKMYVCAQLVKTTQLKAFFAFNGWLEVYFPANRSTFLRTCHQSNLLCTAISYLDLCTRGFSFI